MSRPILYQNQMSCVCQSVLMVIKHIELDAETRFIDFSKGDHLREDFVKINPRHCVPFLVDGDTSIWESHAIIPYLVDKYAKDDSLYPRDLGLRARITALLHFDNAILYTRIRNMSFPLWMNLRKDCSEENLKAAHEACKDLETLIEGPWLLGDRPTIADICCVANIKAMEVFIGETTQYQKLTKWRKHCEKNLAGFEEIIVAGFKNYNTTIKQLMNG